MRADRVVIILITTISVPTCMSSSDSHYTAGVVEYHPIRNSTLESEEITVQIVREYIKLLEENNRTLDIAVFPESTITSHIKTREELVRVSPLIVNDTVPCESDEEKLKYFKDLSCAAKRFNTYLVVNIVEKSVCTQEKCASDRYNLYNTNVVFDRNGKIVARYRKFHLFGEFEKNVTNAVDITTFKTDFGVTFGTFICFDVLFEEPPLWLTRSGIQHLIFPSMWFSKAPFLTALQVQNMFAVATNTVLLASGANNPRVGSGGTGIYEGINGPQTMGIISEGGSKMFVKDVPKNVNKISMQTRNEKSVEIIDEVGLKMDNLYLKQDRFDEYNSFIINDDVDDIYCYAELCCKFTIKISKNFTASQNYYRHRVFVYSGVTSSGGFYKGGIEICAIAFCKNDTVESCGQRIFPYSNIEWITTFETIEISGSFDESPHKMQYPNSLISSLEPLGAQNYEWQTEYSKDKKIRRNIKLTIPQRRLLTFGVYGRYFTKDDAS